MAQRPYSGPMTAATAPARSTGTEPGCMVVPSSAVGPRRPCLVACLANVKTASFVLRNGVVEARGSRSPEFCPSPCHVLTQPLHSCGPTWRHDLVRIQRLHTCLGLGSLVASGGGPTRSICSSCSTTRLPRGCRRSAVSGQPDLQVGGAAELKQGLRQGLQLLQRQRLNACGAGYRGVAAPPRARGVPRTPALASVPRSCAPCAERAPSSAAASLVPCIR